MTDQDYEREFYSWGIDRTRDYLETFSLEEIMNLRDYKLAMTAEFDKKFLKAMEEKDYESAHEYQRLVDIYHYEAHCCFIRELEMTGKTDSTDRVEHYFSVFSWEGMEKFGLEHEYYQVQSQRENI